MRLVAVAAVTAVATITTKAAVYSVALVLVLGTEWEAVALSEAKEVTAALEVVALPAEAAAEVVLVLLVRKAAQVLETAERVLLHHIQVRL